MLLTLLAVLGVVLLVLAALGIGSGPRVQLGWLGLACVAVVLCWPTFAR